MLTAKQTDDKRRTAEAMLAALPLPGAEAGWARQARAEARARLLDMGAPIRRDEYWRMTDPTALTAPLAPLPRVDAVAEQVDPFPGVEAATLVVFNGRASEDGIAALGSDALEATPLSDTLGLDGSWAAELFGQLEKAGQEKVMRPLAALNTAAATDGVALRATGAHRTPLHLRYEQTGAGASLVRHIIRVEPGAELTLLESGLPSNTVIEVDVAPGGRFHHLRLQHAPAEAAATHVFARIGEGAAFKSFSLTADGTLTRNETVLEFLGDDAIGHVAGAVIARGASVIDSTVFVTHAAERCESRQVFKNVLDGEAKGIFQGKIFVRPGAQKTDGYQISQSVLLADGAEFWAKPELEIYADDVQCSHGSTTGALDRTALFYLMSRGVSRADAEAMLVASFVEEAIGEIEDERLADAMRGEVACWMAARA